MPHFLSCLFTTTISGLLASIIIIIIIIIYIIIVVIIAIMPLEFSNWKNSTLLYCGYIL